MSFDSVCLRTSIRTTTVLATLGLIFAVSGAAFGQSPLDGVVQAAEQAALDKSAADRVLAEKTGAVNVATTTLNATTEALKKINEAKFAAERVGAGTAREVAEAAAADLESRMKAAKEALDKGNVERAEAQKIVQQKAAALDQAVKKLVADRGPLETASAAASKGAMDAITSREAAVKAVTQTTQLAATAATTAAASQKASEKAAAEKGVAEAALAEKAKVATAANEAATASQAVATAAAEAKVAAEKLLADKTAAARSASEKATASQKVVESATNDKAAAEKVVVEKTAAAKVAADAVAAEGDAGKKADLEQVATKAIEEVGAAEKSLAEKVAAVKSGDEIAAADKTAAQAASEEKEAAEKGLVEMTAAAKAAADKASADKGAADKLNTEKAAAEKVVADKTNADKAASEKMTADRGAAEKAAAAKTAAESDLVAKTASERTALHAAAEARAIAEGGLKIIPENAWDLAKARHLLVRAGFGGTPAEVAKLHAMGMVQAVNSLVDYQYQPDIDLPFNVDAPERPLPTEGKLSGEERTRLNQRRDAKREADRRRLREWWMRRMVESPRPLQEKLTLFWHGHFVTEWQKVPWPHMMYAQNQLFREHASESFGGLLQGIVHDPAMIVYLDNQANNKNSPNQNLARELMELFSMGVDQGYAEYDLREGARALTGYTYEQYTGQFRFNYANHDIEPKTIFGQTGTWTGDDFVNLILQQPHTARFVSKKLFEFFAHSGPDPLIVDHLASVLRLNQYEMRPMLKNLFMSEQFYSPQAMGTQIKGPVQLLAGFCRDYGVRGVDYNALVSWSGEMGQELLQPPNVKGWYGGRDWINANLIFRRHNYIANLVQSAPQPDGKRGVDVVGLLEGQNVATPEQVVDYLLRASMVVAVNEEQRQALIGHLGELPPVGEWATQRDPLNARLRQLLILILTVPEYQMT